MLEANLKYLVHHRHIHLPQHQNQWIEADFVDDVYLLESNERLKVVILCHNSKHRLCIPFSQNTH